jgi:DNA-directed RNA polymerase specialized sigma24 family protein
MMKMIVGQVVQQEPSIEKKAPAHYVDNKKFYEALVEYRKKVLDAKENNLEKPRVSEYIGECFLKIATHLSYKANFINYTFKDDMISDGIENCLTAVEKFDPERGMNPFAYFTQITFFAFVRRIQKEKKQQATKYKLLENIDIDSILAHSEGNEEFANSLLDGNATTSQLVGSFSALKGTTGLVATAFSKLLSIQEANFAEYQKITSAGANFSGSLTDLRTAAMKSYMTLDQFGTLIKSNTNDLITLGGNVNSGAKAFAQFSNSILSSQAGTNIMALGYTTEGANQAMLTYLGSMGVNNLEQLKSDKNLRASTESYLEELDRLSQVTGKSREELNEKMKKEKMDADIRMTAARMDPKQREAFLANVRYMTTQYGDAGKDMALAQAQGRAVRTKEGQMLSAVAPKMQAAYAEMDKAAKQYGVGSKEYIAAQNQVSLAAQEGLGRIPTAVLSANDAFKGLETAVGTTADQQLAGLTTKEKFDAIILLFHVINFFKT